MKINQNSNREFISNDNVLATKRENKENTQVAGGKHATH